MRTDDGYIIRQCLNGEPEAFGCNVGHAHLDEKIFDKGGFNDDRSTRPLYAKLVNETKKAWFEDDWNKHKVYNIPYQR